MTIQEIASLVGSATGTLSLGWILFQWGRKTEDHGHDHDRATVSALLESQKALTEQVYNIAQVLRDLAASVRTMDQLAEVRHAGLVRQLDEVRQSLKPR